MIRVLIAASGMRFPPISSEKKNDREETGMENQAEKKELSSEQLEPVAGGNDVPELDTDVEGLNMCRSYAHTL